MKRIVHKKSSMLEHVYDVYLIIYCIFTYSFLFELMRWLWSDYVRNDYMLSIFIGHMVISIPIVINAILKKENLNFGWVQPAFFLYLVLVIISTFMTISEISHGKHIYYTGLIIYIPCILYYLIKKRTH